MEVKTPASHLTLGLSERHAVYTQVQSAIEEYYGKVGDLPIQTSLTPGELRRRMEGWDFQNPVTPEKALRFAIDGMEQGHLHTANPNYFGVFNPRAGFMGVAADSLVAAFNPQLASWTSAAFAIEMEDHMLRQFGRLFGFDRTEGSFTSGGMEANHTALLVALTKKFPRFADSGVASLTGQPTLYVSSEAHHSFLKAARISGLGTSAVRSVPATEDFKMDVSALKRQIESDRVSGMIPFMVVATAGTTSAGVIDPIAAIAQAARQNDLWFHVDAAWGGAAILLPELKAQFHGTAAADSITFDAHKWLAMPMGVGVFLSRHAGLLKRTFQVNTAYMPQESLESPLTQPYCQSLQWSRRFIGLKVFLTLAVAGFEGYREILRHQIKMGRLLKEKLVKNGWKILNETDLPVVCFTDSRGAMDAARAKMFAESVAATGKAWITTTKLNGQACLRAGIANFLTEESNLDLLVGILNQEREGFMEVKLADEAVFPSEKWKRILFSVVAFYVLVFLIAKVFPSAALAFGIFNTALQLGLDGVVLFLCLQIIRNSPATERRAFQFLAGAFLASALADALYGLTVNVFGITNYAQTPLELWINIPYISILLLGALGMQGLRERNAGESQLAPLVIAILYFIFAIAFFSAVLLRSIPESQTRIIHILCFFSDSLLLGYALFALSPKRPRHERFIGLGFSLIFLFGLTLQLIEFSHLLVPGLPIELLWVGGQLSIVWGLGERSQLGFGSSASQRLYHTS